MEGRALFGPACREGIFAVVVLRSISDLARGARRPAAWLAALVALATSASASANPKTTAHAHHATRRAKITSPEARSRVGTTTPKDAKPARAESIGSPNEGKLAGGVHLDTSKPYVRVVPTYESGDLRWGLPEMIRMIDRASKAVAKRYPGSVLDVGDISKKGGGDVLRHHSHESGRDADLGFYAVDAHGKQVHAKVFVKFENGSLESTNVPGARFDLARNWLLIQEMLSDPTARVSHVFIEQRLRDQVLAYARTHAASRAIVDRAAQVMMQPHHSLPHDDHIHVRISCPHTRGECVELAKGALQGSSRLAQRGHQRPGRTVLHTPHHHTEPAKPAPLMNAAPQDDDDFVDAPLGAPEAEGDGADAKRSVDEAGAAKITD